MSVPPGVPSRSSADAQAPPITSAALERALDEVGRALTRAPSSVLVEGPPGSGKTTLLRELARRSPAEVEAFFVPFANVPAAEIDRWLLDFMGRSRAASLRERVAAGGRPVWLLLDEAQGLPPESAAHIATLAAELAPRLALVLAGVSGPALEAVARRLEPIGARVRLAEGLTVDEVEGLIARHARGDRDAPDARALVRETDGLPGLVVRALERREFDRTRHLRPTERHPAPPEPTPQVREAAEGSARAPAEAPPAASAAVEPPGPRETPSPRELRETPPPRESREAPPPPVSREPPPSAPPRRVAPSRPLSPAPQRKERRVRPAGLAFGALLLVALYLLWPGTEPAPPSEAPPTGTAEPAAPPAPPAAPAAGVAPPAAAPAAEVAPPPAAAPVAAPVPVHINVRPWARVWIDGREVGETPLADVPVQPGRRELRALLPDGREIRRVVEVDAGTHTLSLP